MNLECDYRSGFRADSNYISVGLCAVLKGPSSVVSAAVCFSMGCGYSDVSNRPGGEAGGDSGMMCGAEMTDFYGERHSLPSILTVIAAM